MGLGLRSREVIGEAALVLVLDVRVASLALEELDAEFGAGEVRGLHDTGADELLVALAEPLDPVEDVVRGDEEGLGAAVGDGQGVLDAGHGALQLLDFAAELLDLRFGLATGGVGSAQLVLGALVRRQEVDLRSEGLVGPGRYLEGLRLRGGLGGLHREGLGECVAVRGGPRELFGEVVALGLGEAELFGALAALAGGEVEALLRRGEVSPGASKDLAGVLEIVEETRAVGCEGGELGGEVVALVVGGGEVSGEAVAASRAAAAPNERTM